MGRHFKNEMLKSLNSCTGVGPNVLWVQMKGLNSVLDMCNVQAICVMFRQCPGLRLVKRNGIWLGEVVPWICFWRERFEFAEYNPRVNRARDSLIGNKVSASW